MRRGRASGGSVGAGPCRLTAWVRAHADDLPDTAGHVPDDTALTAVRALFAHTVRPGAPSPADATRLLPVPEALQRLDAAAARTPTLPVLRWAEDADPVVQRRPVPDHADLTATLAQAAIAFLAGPDRHPLRACHAPRCVRYFLKDHPRQEWCQPSCGNRARVARHHERHKQASWKALTDRAECGGLRVRPTDASAGEGSGTVDAEDPVVALGRLMGAAAQEGRARIDWSRVEQIWDIRFPSDYVRFMEAYGPGLVSEAVVVLDPVPRPERPRDGSGLLEETENARLTWEMEGEDADFDADPATILAWGVTSGADLYCWLTTDDDPDRWPVLIWGRHTSPAFQLHPFGMAEFLHRLLADPGFQEETISVELPEPASFAAARPHP
ncbi:hypothetical protein GCM10010251_74450 [Streptomyces aurantiogriseus]|uniref:Zinc finger CGNR domain-containing protein n=2 Tax=Streptomyces aurantiogriseus TaxID=66870 RepID=A0A918FKB9_9ACTN|nr:hypothetical protein GCM10010251_74450 [Streptomyces aurantiogriseus]